MQMGSEASQHLLSQDGSTESILTTRESDHAGYRMVHDSCSKLVALR